MTIRRTTTAVATGVIAGALLLSACGGGDDGSGGEGGGSGDGQPGGEVRPVTIHATSANQFETQFNPLLATYNQGTRGFIYEPLTVFTAMDPGNGKPWLAESMEFNEDGTAVTFSLRPDVTWSDGEAFTADDVVFTFETMRDEPATNAGALPIASASAVDDLTAEVTFDSPVFALEPSIGNITPVPEHIFADETVAEFTNPEPVGTGPFVLSDFTQQLYTLEANPSYWNADEVDVQEVRYPASTTQTFNTSLQAGEFDWSGGFVANIDQIFVGQDPEHNHYWYPGDGLVNLLVNLQKEPFSDVELRKAISLAIDREALSTTAMQGYNPPAHPTGLPLPAFESFLEPDRAGDTFTRDVEQANSILDAAGYEEGDDGVRVAPDGERMSYDLHIPSDWVDWVSIATLLQEQLADIGIEAAPQGVSFEAWLQGRNSGTYSMTIASAVGGASPYFLYRAFMSSEYQVEPGEDAAQNFNRWYDDTTDDYFDAYEASDDEAERLEAIHGLQGIVAEQLPLIPLLQSPNWFQYRTEFWEGWPSEDNPYALPAPYQYPDNLLVITNLTPAG
ncbi:ABC transporter substrate-binding protein [Phytoactinopolyspora alkaliphila]|uniref:ABC transporter substrate-binding protein n=1 Tax=Phytoactinopolyspora alkaliphila TaxID=1783498 RepID=A0A6N9YSM5_9ACTN|nr:ABC transporter substrate-binding protein [Phytoactinopolyspora alkaliphila]NED97982.1 ABC transporter substrate-binding protein [Phytoactinopolyspora alkaliphila]